MSLELLYRHEYRSGNVSSRFQGCTDMKTKRKHSRSSTGAYQQLEDRRMLTTALFVDFGDRFVAGELTDDVESLVSTMAGANPAVDGPVLRDSAGVPYDNGTSFTLTAFDSFHAGADPSNMRAEIMRRIRKTFRPFDIEVIELTTDFQSISGGVQVRSASDLADVSITIGANESESENNDAYLFVGRMLIDGSFDPFSEYRGIASETDVGGANDHDGTGFAFLSAGDTPAAISSQISYQAGRLFGLHSSFGNDPVDPPVGSLINGQIHDSDVMSFRSFTGRDMFSRFPLVRGDGNLDEHLLAASSPAPPNRMTLFDQLAFDPNIGKSDIEYVTGTGAHDQISLIRQSNSIRVNIAAFSDPDFTLPITVPGYGGTVFTYTIPLDRHIVVDAGRGDDLISVSTILDAEVSVFGMQGVDSLFFEGDNREHVIFLPGAEAGSELEGVATLGGIVEVTRNTRHSTRHTPVSFAEFDADSEIRIRQVQTLDYETPSVSNGRGDDQITISDDPANANGLLVTGRTDDVNIVRLTFSATNTVTWNLGANDSAPQPGILNDVVTIIGNPRSTALRNPMVLAGPGDDRLEINSTEEFALTGGFPGPFFTGGDGRDTVRGPDARRTYSIERSGEGHTSGLDFTGIEVIRGGNQNDYVQVSTPWQAGIHFDGGDGQDRLLGGPRDGTWVVSSPGSGSKLGSSLSFSQVETILGHREKNDTFYFAQGNLGMEVAGGGPGGFDRLFGRDSDERWEIGNSFGNIEGTARDLGVSFSGFELVAGGSGDDEFNLLSSSAPDNVEIASGAGFDRMISPLYGRTWYLTGHQSGRIEDHTSSVMDFSGFELIESKSDGFDRYYVEPGNIGISIQDSSSYNDIFGPDLARDWQISGPNSGFLTRSNITWNGIQKIYGGDKADRVVFVNGDASIRLINGGGGFNHLDYGNLESSVDVLIKSYSDRHTIEADLIEEEFLFVSMLSGGVNTDDRISFNRAGVTTDWLISETLSRFSNSRVSEDLFFDSFEHFSMDAAGLHSFTVSPFVESELFISGRPPANQNITLNLGGVQNPRWNYTGPGMGEFSADNRMAVRYINVERLNVFDFGDAPASFSTHEANDGARHRLSAIREPIFLGTGVDPDADGQPGAFASFDDTDGADDDDGVVLPQVLIPRFRSTAFVNASAEARLDAWIDFDGNGTFSELERIADGIDVEAGENRLEFITPSDSVFNRNVIARFRLSHAGGLMPSGSADSGEVEDYVVRIRQPLSGTIGIYADPMQLGVADQHILVVAGTTMSDQISVEDTGNGALQVSVNQTLWSPIIADFDIVRIGAFGLQGRDTMMFDPGLTMSVEAFGDWGNDTISGGAQSDFLVGGSGHDEIHGNAGDDLIFGNAGNDLLYGEAGDDLLAGSSGNDQLFGSTGTDTLMAGSGADELFGGRDDDLLAANMWIFDSNSMALEAIHNEWTSGRTYNSRILHLLRGVKEFLDGTGWKLESGTTLIDDNASDVLRGSLDRDTFFSVFANDLVADLESHEQVN
ncbi:MAG: GEVED domain-containing protein [Planctomycetota bacterium]